jgi:PilZ domain
VVVMEGIVDMNKDSRRTERYSWLSFEAKVHVKRSFFVKEWIPVVPFDFSRFGLGIQTDETFVVGEEVQLMLELENEDLDLTVPTIRGIVRYKTKIHSRFDYGVEFVFPSKLSRHELDDDLIRIERALHYFETSRSADGA